MKEGQETKNLCRQCRFYFVTWNPQYPHGCKAIGFKSRNIPCIDVYTNSGIACQSFQAKDTARKTSGGGKLL
jgi:hypothetical protein